MNKDPGPLLSDRVHGRVLHHFCLDLAPPKGTHQASQQIVLNKKTGRRMVVRPKHSPGERTKRMYVNLLPFFRPRKPLHAPLGLSIAWIHKVPKALKKELINSGSDFLYHTKIPDNVNVAKIIEDALEDCRFFMNDCQISDHVLRKRYALQPRIEVTLYHPEL